MTKTKPVTRRNVALQEEDAVALKTECARRKLTMAHVLGALVRGWTTGRIKLSRKDLGQ
jgi:hypothetical protein